MGRKHIIQNLIAVHPSTRTMQTRTDAWIMVDARAKFNLPIHQFDARENDEQNQLNLSYRINKVATLFKVTCL